MGENDQSVISRRRLLAGIGVAGSSALAGCGSSSDAEIGGSSEKDIPAPKVDAGEQWTLKTTDSEPQLLLEGSKGGVNYTAHGHTVRYEDNKLRDRIKSETFGEIDRPFAVAFAARVEIFPSLASMFTGLVNEKIKENLQQNLSSAMEDFGVQNIQKGGTMDAPNTPANKFQVIRGDYPIEEAAITGVDIPHSDVEELTFGGEKLPIKGIVGRWKSNGSIMAGGGVYPDANFVDSEVVEMSNAIEMSVSINLNIRPQQRERELFNFVRSISR